MSMSSYVLASFKEDHLIRVLPISVFDSLRAAMIDEHATAWCVAVKIGQVKRSVTIFILCVFADFLFKKAFSNIYISHFDSNVK